MTYFGDPINIPVNSGAAISKPEEKKGGIGVASAGITPSGGGGVSGNGGARVGARDISGGNVGGGNPLYVQGSRKMLTKEEY